MSEVSHPIPYQGSKRKLAARILAHVPIGTKTLIEPFCGSAALSLAAAQLGLVQRFRLNDSLVPLAKLWRRIIEDPGELADEYERIWNAQSADPRVYYDRVRDEFNQSNEAGPLLFLLTRCVKNAVRFNARGEFNQSPDTRRLGTRPPRMRQQILGASELLRGRTMVSSGDYAAVLEEATSGDLVYLDPPYQGTSRQRDQRYYQSLELERLIEDIQRLLLRKVPLIISFDGRLGELSYGPELPAKLGLMRLELFAGRSSQATLNGENVKSFESLYLSPELADRTR